MVSAKLSSLIIGVIAVAILGISGTAKSQTLAPPTKPNPTTSPLAVTNGTKDVPLTRLPNYPYQKYCLLVRNDDGESANRRATILGIPARLRFDSRDETVSDGWPTSRKVKLTRPTSSAQEVETSKLSETCTDYGYFQVPGTLSVTRDGTLLVLNLEFQDNQGTRYYISRSLTSSPTDRKNPQPVWYQTSESHGDFQFFVYLTDKNADVPNRYLQNYRVEIFKLGESAQRKCLEERPKFGVTVFKDIENQCPITMYFQQNGVGAGNEPR